MTGHIADFVSPDLTSPVTIDPAPRVGAAISSLSVGCQSRSPNPPIALIPVSLFNDRLRAISFTAKRVLTFASASHTLPLPFVHL
jgi:hypothetical protein